VPAEPAPRTGKQTNSWQPRMKEQIDRSGLSQFGGPPRSGWRLPARWAPSDGPHPMVGAARSWHREAGKLLAAPHDRADGSRLAQPFWWSFAERMTASAAAREMGPIRRPPPDGGRPRCS
jgi:hypothetical protein